METLITTKMPLAPLRCAVKLYKINTRCRTWAEHSTDGWYLGTSSKHYRCHKIYVKKTRAKRISDTVFFKHKYITQPTLTQADTIVKALDDLTHTLKGRKNVKVDAQIKALEQIDKLLNSIPKKVVTRKEQHVTFDESTAPPRETNATPRTLTTTQQTTTQKSITKAAIDKSITNQTPTPRVHSKLKENTLPEQMKLHQRLQEAATNQARLPHRYNMQFCQQEQLKRVQLISNNKTGEYLNYWQLNQDPKHKEIWNTSAANEFGRLTQGVGGRVKATNTIFFIRKDQVPKDQMKDVTYGSFSCNMKPNKTETHQTCLTAGGDRIKYPEDVGSPTADMTLVKTLLNSLISTKGPKCVMLDIEDFYLNTPMKRYEYMHIKITDIPEEIINEHKMSEIATDDGYIFCKIQKGMMAYHRQG